MDLIENFNVKWYISKNFTKVKGRSSVQGKTEASMCEDYRMVVSLGTEAATDGGKMENQY